MAARSPSITAFLPAAVMAVHDALAIHLHLQDIESREALRMAVEALSDGARSLGLDCERVTAALEEIWADVARSDSPDHDRHRRRLLDWAFELSRANAR